MRKLHSDLSNLLELMDPVEGRIQRGGVQSEDYLDSKEIKPVNLKGNQSWILIGRTDAEAPILWPPEARNWLIGKDPDAGKDWRQEEKGTTENEMVGWHHQLDGHEFEQAPGVGDGQRGLCVLQSTGLQRVGHDWATEQQMTPGKVGKVRPEVLAWARYILLTAQGFFLFYLENLNNLTSFFPHN